MKENLREFDIVRAFAALAVIAIHITSSQFVQNPVALVWDALMWFAVPCFIILSGVTLHYRYKDTQALDYITFVQKRASKVLLPYVLWTLIYMVYDFKSKGIQIGNLHFLVTFLKNLVTGNGFSHLYFMVIILQYYLLYPLLKKAIEASAKGLVILALLMTGVFQLDPLVHLWGIHWLPHWLTPYNVILFPRWSLYFVFGMIIGAHREAVYQWIVTRKDYLYWAWGTVAICLILQTRTYGALKPMMYPTIMLYALISFVLLWRIGVTLKAMDTTTIRHLDWLSQNSFVVYLSHLLLVRLIAMPMVSLLGFNVWNGTIGLVGLYIFTVGISVGFTQLLCFMPGGQWLGAVRQTRPVSIRE